jgi:Fe-S-cluster-containing hydrogenase component 2
VGYKIHFSRELCDGCKVCERVCSMAHNSLVPKIKIVGEPGNFEAMVCVQCEMRSCVKVCDHSAIFIDEGIGSPIISSNLCTRCMKCVLACESSGLHFDPIKREIVVCDTCNQSFLCVLLCSNGALSKVIVSKPTVSAKSF